MLLGQAPAGDEDSIRSQAVVNLTFDEVSGAAYDSAATGFKKDNGRLTTGAERVESPFWNQRGKVRSASTQVAKERLKFRTVATFFVPTG